MAPAGGLGEGAGEAGSALEGPILTRSGSKASKNPRGDGRSRMRPSRCTRLSRRSACRSSAWYLKRKPRNGRRPKRSRSRRYSRVASAHHDRASTLRIVQR